MSKSNHAPGITGARLNLLIGSRPPDALRLGREPMSKFNHVPTMSHVYGGHMVKFAHWLPPLCRAHFLSHRAHQLCHAKYDFYVMAWRNVGHLVP